MNGFVQFIRERAIAGLAIGFILGGATSELVRAFINDIVNPLLGLLLGKVEGLTTASFSVFGAEILWGDFVSVLINFFVLAGVVYLGFKWLKLDTPSGQKS